MVVLPQSVAMMTLRLSGFIAFTYASGGAWRSRISFSTSSSSSGAAAVKFALENEVDVVLLDSERQPCEIWSRVMGYHRPVAAFNKGKQQEHRDRVFFTEGSSARLMRDAA